MEAKSKKQTIRSLVIILILLIVMVLELTVSVSAAVISGYMPESNLAASCPFVVTGGTYGIDYAYYPTKTTFNGLGLDSPAKNNLDVKALVIYGNGNYDISANPNVPFTLGKKADVIYVANFAVDSTLNITDVHLDTDNVGSDVGSPFIIASGATNVTLKFAGNNYFGGEEAAPGIGVLSGASVIIDKVDGLNDEQAVVEVYSNDNGAGIGGWGKKNAIPGAITINGGTIVASSTRPDNQDNDGQGAGIGGGKDNPNGAITINGGIITATSGGNPDDSDDESKGQGAGIGAGSGASHGNITINGGRVTAYSGIVEGYGAGIGGGYQSNKVSASGTITVNGGTIVARPAAPGGTDQKEAVDIGNTVKTPVVNSTLIVNGGSLNVRLDKMGAINKPITNGASSPIDVELKVFTKSDLAGDAVENTQIIDSSEFDGVKSSQNGPIPNNGIYGIHTVYTDNNGDLYLWLPKSSTGDTLVSTTDKKYAPDQPGGLNLREILKYAFSATAGSGGSVSGSSTKGSYYAGSTITIKATPDNGYKFIGWIVNGVILGDDKSANTSFIMPDGNVTVIANFERTPTPLVPPQPPTPLPDTSVPKTGDNRVSVWVWYTLVIASAAAFSVVVRKRLKRRHSSQ